MTLRVSFRQYDQIILEEHYDALCTVDTGLLSWGKEGRSLKLISPLSGAEIMNYMIYITNPLPVCLHSLDREGFFKQQSILVYIF
jgi:hypothetical protein